MKCEAKFDFNTHSNHHIAVVKPAEKPETEITQRGPPVKPPFKRSQVGIVNGNSNYFVAEIFFNSFLSITCLITIWAKSNAKVVCIMDFAQNEAKFKNYFSFILEFIF